ncbi:hypothetical protein EJ08DRAFT_655014 [Tothia fuscella]|uniref:Uncharacterized protein n=1 Tax=Tothia fuscella TaxID=1048955 RepID=A0A9P4P3U2_9PEZI|nr:hypothetical protein EJ08DRAFT_655014 [Tothia fuscella]
MRQAIELSTPTLNSRMIGQNDMRETRVPNSKRALDDTKEFGQGIQGESMAKKYRPGTDSSIADMDQVDGIPSAIESAGNGVYERGLALRQRRTSVMDSMPPSLDTPTTPPNRIDNEEPSSPLSPLPPLSPLSPLSTASSLYTPSETFEQDIEACLTPIENLVSPYPNSNPNPNQSFRNIHSHNTNEEDYSKSDLWQSMLQLEREKKREREEVEERARLIMAEYWDETREMVELEDVIAFGETLDFERRFGREGRGCEEWRVRLKAEEEDFRHDGLDGVIVRENGGRMDEGVMSRVEGDGKDEFHDGNADVGREMGKGKERAEETVE